MLNVYISADLEGVSGVVYPHQTSSEGKESYISAIKQQHKELNCIINTLIKMNVGQITVNDAHCSMENIKLAEINPKVEIITGKLKPMSMLSGLNEKYSCLFLTGCHARAGSLKGVLAHTFSEKYHLVKINGKAVGEIELNAIYAGLQNVPVSLVTGDNIACKEAIDEIGNINTVITKNVISTTSAICKPEETLLKELEEKVKLTVKTPQSWKKLEVKPPYALELNFTDRKTADLTELLPCIKRLSATAVLYTSDDYTKVYKLLQFLTATV